MKIQAYLVAISSLLGIGFFMPSALAQITPYPVPGALEQSIYDYQHEKMRRQRRGEDTPSRRRPIWQNRRFKSNNGVTFARIKETAPILMWNSSRHAPAFTSLHVIGTASAGEQVRVTQFRKHGLIRVFFMRKGVRGWVKPDNLIIQ